MTSPEVAVVDTVGAGDAFGAALLHWLWTQGSLAADAVALDETRLAEAIGFAAAVGALQCARAGAVPPTLAEVDAFLSAERAGSFGM